MKRFISLVLMLVLSMSSSVFANSNSKEQEVKELISWAQSQGFEIKGDIDSMDYANIDVNEVRNQLLTLSSIGKSIELDEDDRSSKVKMGFNKNVNMISTRSLDEKTIPMIVTKKCTGTKTIDGRNYNYKVYVYVDYNCLLNSNNEPIGVDSINSITSDAGSASFIVDYEHDTGTEVETISGRKASVRGQGVFDFEISGVDFRWRVLWKTSFNAGDGEQI